MKLAKPLVRHELKAIINDGQYEILKSALSVFLHPDPHMGNEGYFIRSLYFDDGQNHGFEDKIEGLYKRFKLRLRIYSFETTVIKLEVKGKRGDRVLKHTYEVSRCEAEEMIAGLWPTHLRDKLLKEGILCQSYYPKIIIDYMREAYTYPYQKIRLTFDRHICVTYQINQFFESNQLMIPLQDEKQCVFEIKYEDMLPDFVADFIAVAGITLSGYSKYVNGRKTLEY